MTTLQENNEERCKNPQASSNNDGMKMNTTDNWKKQVISFPQVQEICNKQTIARACFFCSSWEQRHNHLFATDLPF